MAREARRRPSKQTVGRANVRGWLLTRRATPRAADPRRNERLHDIEQRERRDTDLQCARNTAVEQRQLRDAAGVDDGDSRHRGKPTRAKGLGADAERSGDERGRGVRDQIAARRSEESSDARRADRREYRQPDRTRREIQRHARRAGDGTEPHAGENDEQRLQRDRNRRPWKRNRDLRRRRDGGGKADDADERETRGKRMSERSPEPRGGC